MTNATCGLRGFLSSPSAALQSSLESKLKRRLDGAGSTLFSLTWKAKATPAGRPYCQLAASARRTSETGFGSWPTPAAQEPGGTLEMHNARRRKAIAKGIKIGASSQGAMSHAAQLAAWPTPKAQEDGRTLDQYEAARQRGYQRRIGKTSGGPASKQGGLAIAAQLAPTPMAGTPAQKGYNEAGNTDSGRKTVALAGWPTATSSSGGDNTNSASVRERGHGNNLEGIARKAWATPRAEDSESSGMRWSRGVADTLTAQASLAHWITPQTHDVTTRGNTNADHHYSPHDLSNQALLAASGPTPNGSPAQTESPGQLDPDHSRWVMGYRAEHLSCAPTETPSFLKSQRRSFVPRFSAC